jgi:hypothetical protein
VKGNRQILYPGMGGLPQEGILNVKNKSHTITAEIVVAEGGAEGVIVNQAGFSAGWVVYLKQGRLKYGYNLAILKHFYVEAGESVPTGTHQVRMEFAYDGGGLAKGATITLFVDGNKVGDGHLDATIPIGFSADETTDVGRDTGSRVVPDFNYGFLLTGRVNWVAIETDDDDQTHLITPEQQFASTSLSIELKERAIGGPRESRKLSCGQCFQSRGHDGLIFLGSRSRGFRSEGVAGLAARPKSGRKDHAVPRRRSSESLNLRYRRRPPAEIAGPGDCAAGRSA